VIDYATEQALGLAEHHNAIYDCAHLLWGGDFVTNEGIYSGQFEDLDAWLDEQHDILVAPLLRQLKAFSERFTGVQVVCQVGNHGQHRASGTSRQANADLVLYKHLRNTVAQLVEHGGILGNVDFKIGQAKAYRNFQMRSGAVQGHLRHGQHRKPQAETSARKKAWLSTLREHGFDVAYMGHHHVGGRIPWDGPPILASPSPKPSGEFVEKLGESVAGGEQGIATCHGVSDDGITCVYPIDTRNY
jgi:predicted phosphodiesterase